MKGKALPLGVHSVLLDFSAQEIVTHAATKTKDGFADKEEALIAALTKLVE